MYRTDNKLIGQHLSELIKASRYKNDRQFSIAYLEKRDGEANPDDIPKMQNRICQIKKGNKGVQIEDLPIFSELLGVSIDEILSGGTFIAPAATRVTNYTIAFSKNQDDWEEFINREDKPFLNPDEYNKTVIDYALEAGNYEFLKYLMDNNYIWFVSGDRKQYHEKSFGAGTSVERREIGYTDVLDTRLREQDDLRYKMIALAIKNNDIKMLEKLKAREIPLLYTVNHIFSGYLENKELVKTPNVLQMIDSVAAASNTILSYFFSTFEVKQEYGDAVYTFMSPYAGDILDEMIRLKKKNINLFLERVLEHNRNVLQDLNQQTEDGMDACRDLYKVNEYIDEKYMKHITWNDYYVYPRIGFVSYHTPAFYKKVPIGGFITNIVRVNSKSKDPEIQFLIDEVNKTYNKFIDLQKNKEV